MDRIRPFTQDDLPQVARLYQQIFGGGVLSSFEPLESYFQEVFFESPSSDHTLPSLIYETDIQRIAGFLGVLPRRFTLNGRSLKAAVSTQLMVDDRSRHRLGALKLLQAFFAGPQEFSFTDGANEASRRTWMALGGADIPIYSLCWTRQLEPCEDGQETAPRLIEEDLNMPTLLDNLPRLTRQYSLSPEYDAAALSWLLGLAKEKKKHGVLHKRVLHNAEGIEGWYVYYLNAGGASQVLQLVASPQSFSAVLDQLFRSLRGQGAAAVSGRLDPRYLHEYSRQQCQFSAGSAVLARASVPGLLEAIYRGDAMLSRLEGEWWTCFNEFITGPRPARESGARTIP